jgi:hypothetical protein
MADDRPRGTSLAILKGAIVALLVVAAAFAPSSTRADAPTAATIDRVSDAGAAVIPGQVEADLRTVESTQDTVPAGAAPPTAAPTRTLPPTDTDLPAVDGAH